MNELPGTTPFLSIPSSFIKDEGDLFASIEGVFTQGVVEELITLCPPWAKGEGGEVNHERRLIDAHLPSISDVSLDAICLPLPLSSPGQR